MAGGFQGARVVLIDRSDDTFHADGAHRRRALERHGCQVTAVEVTGGSVLERLRRLDLAERVARAIRSTSPDLVLVARRESLDAADLGSLRGLSQARWGLWTSDDMPDLPALKFVAKGYDRIFSSGTDVVQAIEADFPGKASYLPLACDPSFHRPMRARGPFRANVVFAGRATESREMLLGGLVEYGLALWGPGWRKTLLRDYCRGELPKADDYVRAYAGATVAINIHHSAALDPALASRGCNQRLFELAGIGALQLVDFRADMGSLFSPGEELLVYHNGDELRELVRRALYDQPYRDTIAEAGRKRALHQHTYMHRMLVILSDMLPATRKS
ncbi:MAG: glycosyltransferase [Gemmatimonadota bacterium]